MRTPLPLKSAGVGSGIFLEVLDLDPAVSGLL
jgi:hypothetical protein